MAIPLLRRRPSEQTISEEKPTEDVPPSPGQNHRQRTRSFSFPTTILFLVLLTIWATSTLLSGSVFHICVSSRKLNVYCISGGTGKDHGLVTSTDSTIHHHKNNEDDDQNTIKLSTSTNSEKANAIKVVEENMRLLRSFAGKRSSWESEISCENRRIFVYELPPKFNYELMGHCHDLLPWEDLCNSFSNEAMGIPISSAHFGDGWFNTHEYSLEPIVHQRVLTHPCRTHNQSEAALFYVPFYGGLNVLRWSFNNNNNNNNNNGENSGAVDLLGVELLSWLETQKSWIEHQGKDHVFVLGKISWDFRRRKNDTWGSNFLNLDQMRNPYKLVVERQPWEVNDIGIPHPTHFHPHSDEDIINWQTKIISSPRNHLVGYTEKDSGNDDNSLKSTLISQCTSPENNNSTCLFLDCGKNSCSGRPETVIDLFMESEFCLHPPANNPSRKSLFDGLVAGCIPVIFDKFTAYYQYPWHLPEDHGKYSVFVEAEDALTYQVNVLERLRGVTKEERDEMRRYIVYQLMPGLLYGDSTSEFKRFNDAFGLAIDNILNAVTTSRV